MAREGGIIGEPHAWKAIVVELRRIVPTLLALNEQKETVFTLVVGVAAKMASL